MHYGAEQHRNGAGNIVFLKAEEKPENTGESRYAEQQNAEAPIPTRIKKIACTNKKNHSLLF